MQIEQLDEQIATARHALAALVALPPQSQDQLQPDLSAMKTAMGDINKDDMIVALENFVLSIFAAADNDERKCETVGKAQAIAFKRAADFIEVLTLYPPLSEDWQQKRKYSLYNAGTILKCLKIGEPMVRGNPFEPE